MENKVKKGTIALVMLVTIVLSGLTGFAGSYLANNFKGEAATLVLNGQTATNNIMLTSTSKAPGKILSIEEIAGLTTDSVVEITTETMTTDMRMRQFVSQGAGSGVIATSDGYIITNNHVIEGASKITVRTTSKKTYSATLVGRDTKSDLAVIKIKASNLKPAVYGDSSKLIVGELAVAIGNPLGELGGTVTEGIISALNRDIIIDGTTMNLLQTSAAINPGNSGGGLFNEYGELVGIVNAKSSGSGIEGIGFAIPVNTAKSIINNIIHYGYVPGRIDTGLTLLDVSDTVTAMRYRLQSTGLYVQKINDNSALFNAGDLIVSIDGTTVSNSSDFNKIIEKHKVGDVLKVVVNRDDTNLEINLKLKQAAN
jgi:serine protease Do